MDLSYERQGQTFEWDSAKATANFRKHRVGFEQACEAFFDPFLRLVEASVRGEAREAVIGMSDDWTLLFVVHIARQGDVLRIISARTATAAERRTYENE